MAIGSRSNGWKITLLLWYTLLFLFEFRYTRLLLANQFPAAAAASIVSFHVDSDVVSLDGREPLQADAEVSNDGELHVTIQKSTSSRGGGDDAVSKITAQPMSGLSFSVTP